MTGHHGVYNTCMAANAHKHPDGVVEVSTPIQFLKGAGPDRAHLLAKLGLNTASDLLFQFPRSYQDMSAQAAIAELEDGKGQEKELLE